VIMCLLSVEEQRTKEEDENSGYIMSVREYIVLSTNMRAYLKTRQFLGAFAKLRKATISFVMSVRPHRTTRFQLDGYS